MYFYGLERSKLTAIRNAYRSWLYTNRSHGIMSWQRRQVLVFERACDQEIQYQRACDAYDWPTMDREPAWQGYEKSNGSGL